MAQELNTKELALAKDPLAARLLACDRFTYGGMQRELCHGDHGRAIDRMIQRLRRAGAIVWKRDGLSVVWSPTEKGLQMRAVGA